MLSTILSQVGLPLLIEFVAQGLKRLSHPAAKVASDALLKVEEAIADGGIKSEDMAEANRHAEVMASIRLKEYETSLEQINASIRAEVLSSDKYVRRMRPTFGYLMAGTWALQMGALSYVIVFETERAAQLMHGMASLSTIWAVGLSVLGVYVYKRSEDKKLSSLTKDMLTQIDFKKGIDREVLPSQSNYNVNE
ncbi:MAG: ribokinase [Alphaproteobacteria bacterium]|nr:ribokinase [Alphaproteobacteria bacterium]